MKFPRIVWTRGLFFFLIVWLCLGNQTARAQEVAAKMRVGLSRFAAASELTLRAEPGARLLDGDGRECAAGSGPFVLTRVGDSVTARDTRGRKLGETASNTFWRLQSDESATVLTIATAKNAAHRYRGELEIGATGGRLHVVNEVGLEDYVRGVIGPEMGSRAPIEALKAQAVASRTFALSSLGRWTTDGYDLRDSTESQVYSGVEAERPECDRAVRDTSGLILTVGGHPITAYFCDDCGGVTAPGDTPDDCPHSVSDLDAHGATDKPLPPTWTLTFTVEKLTALLTVHNASGGATTSPNPLLVKEGAIRNASGGGTTPDASGSRRNSAHSMPVGMTLVQIAVLETDVSGRVRRLRLTWVPDRKAGKNLSSSASEADTDTSHETDSGVEGRNTAKSGKQSKEDRLPAGAVTRDIPANTLRTLLGTEALRSTLFTIHRTAEGTFVIEGRGWGHGRGLCQVGAMALAAAPRSFDFRAILRRYYAGATLAPLGASEESEEGASAPPAAAPPRKN